MYNKNPSIIPEKFSDKLKNKNKLSSADILYK